MNVDLQVLAMWAGAIGTLITFAKLVVSPFSQALKKNNESNDTLQKAVEELTRDLKESQKDRENIHKILEKHADRIDHTEDKIIVHDEQLKTLFKSRG